MTIDIVIPTLGESITEATVLCWLKAAGDPVERDEVVVEIETDKATLELVAPETGMLTEILKGEGETVVIGEIIGRITLSGERPQSPARVEPSAAASPQPDSHPAGQTATPLSPAVRRLVEEHAVDPTTVVASGRGGRLTKGDVLHHLEVNPAQEPATAPVQSQPEPSQPAQPQPAQPSQPAQPGPARSTPPPPRQPVQSRVKNGGERRERREPMSRIRRRIAERLVQAQQTAAILTTFNEIDMSAILALRAQYGAAFTERFGVSLGLLGFFAKASVEALRAFPAINAEIRGEDIVYKNYYDLGIAIATDQGLLVPVIRSVDTKSLAEIETELAELSQRARAGKITVEELTGGTFSISNGGVFGSLLSTPILNPPQSGILGLHRIEKRPVVSTNDAVVVRSMMYVALSYDHRIVDGREAVLCLRRIKDCIEDPNRLLLGL